MSKENKIKISEYNFYQKISNNLYIAYNSLANSVMMLNPETYHLLKNNHNSTGIDGNIIDPEFLYSLLKNGFLLNGDLDEIGILKSRYKLTNANKILSLSIILTRLCNFDCSYCCVQKDSRDMSSDTLKEVQRSLYIAARQQKHIFITYFGGEPLLRLDLISEISTFTEKICKENKTHFSQSLVTNGYLLNETTRKKLLELGIVRIQVTLDGPRDIHNKMRPLKGGGATFDAILENIQACINEGFHCSLKSLYNLESYSCQYELIDLLVRKNIHKKLNYFPQLIKPQFWNPDACNLCTLPFTSKKESLARLNILHYAHKNDIKVTPFALKNRYCTAEYPNVYFVDVDGYLYKCGFLLTKKFSVGHIGELNSLSLKEHNDTFLPDPFSDNICSRCKFLPLCMGGCKYLKEQQKNRNCISAKYNFKEYLNLFLLCELSKNSTETNNGGF